MKYFGPTMYIMFNLISIIAAISYLTDRSDTQALIIFETNLILAYLQDIRNTNASKDS